MPEPHPQIDPRVVHAERVAPAPAAPVRVGPDPEIRTDRLTLRPLRASDCDAFIELVRASRAALDATMPIHEPEETDAELFERQLALTEGGERTGRAMRRVGVLAGGALAGAFNLVHIERGLSSEADINWWIDTRLTGRGLATEGVTALVRHALADLPTGLGLSQMVAGIAPDHGASERVAEKAGFRLRPGGQHYLRAGGRWIRHETWIATHENVAAA